MTDLKDMKIDLCCLDCGSTEIVHTFTIWNSKGTEKKGIVAACEECYPRINEFMNMLGTKRRVVIR